MACTLYIGVGIINGGEVFKILSLLIVTKNLISHS